jgi:A/G-specific adenine glycosylase
MQEFNGGFPNNYNDILKLKGVGEYTAAAISSFAFDEAQAVIDGNVMRVLSRFFGVTDAIDSKEGKAQLVKLSKEHLNQKDPATHNQAIMEFGALQCTPVSPDCSNCPLAKGCFALANEMVGDLPWKEKKTVVKPMHIAYAVFINEDRILMKQRKGEGIWEGLFDFPSIVSEAPIDTQQAAQQMLQTRDWKDTLLSEVSEEVTHILSHRKIKARFFRINVLHKPHNIQNGEKWLTKSELAEKGIPRLIENYLKEIDWYE